jgi:hypothetical protein
MDWIMSIFIGIVVPLIICLLGLFILTQNSDSKFGLVMVIIGLVFLLKPAFGHDHNHPERNEWLKSLHSKEKTWCCDGNDTDAIEEWETKGNKYRVKFGGQWFDVPEGALVDGPNKQGEALLWMNKGWGGPSVRCFMPGALT